MPVRPLTAGAAVWLALFLVGYVWFVRAMGGEPAAFYVVDLVVAVLSCAAAALSRQPRAWSIVALATAAAAMLAGLLSVGLLLLPAVGALAVAVAVAGGRRTSATPAG